VLRVRARYQYEKKKGKKKELSQEARARSKKTRELLTAPQASLSLSKRGGMGGMGGNFFLILVPKNKSYE